MKEVSIQGQTVGGAFFGVKLGSKNIIACNGGCKAAAIVRLTHAVACIRRLGVETVHEVEVAAIGHVAPHSMGSAAMAISFLSLLP